MSDLFRKQVIDNQEHRLVGKISLAQPLSSSLVTFSLLAITLSIVAFLCLAEYARKETVKGYLKPEKGLIKAHANRNGVVETLFVLEGSSVKAGDPLFLLTSSQSLASGEELSDKLSKELRKQLEWLADETTQNTRLHDAGKQRIEQRKNILQQSLEVLSRQIELQLEKIGLLAAQSLQYQKLHDEGFISELELQQQLERQLSSKQELESLNRSRLEQQNEVAQLQHELIVLPDQFSLTQADIARKQSDIQRQLSQLENNHRVIVKATHSGTVTAIQVEEGQTVTVNALVLSLLPQGTELVAELMLPTRSAGFIKAGDVARLRFEAFPHQRFGLMQSHISQIDQVLVSSNSGNIPIQLVEPVYRVRSKLHSQVIQGYGSSFPLKSGMLLEADIILDKRSILDWLLDPIYSLRGRIG